MAGQPETLILMAVVQTVVVFIFLFVFAVLFAFVSVHLTPVLYLVFMSNGQNDDASFLK